MSRIKTQIDSIISTYGTNVTHRVLTLNADIDAWGNPQTDSSADTTIKVVKDNNFVKQISLVASGRDIDANASLIASADVTFDMQTSKIIFGGQTYNITSIESLELSGENLAQIIEIGLDSSN